VNRRIFCLSAAALLAGCRPKSRPTVDLRIESDGDFLAFKPDLLTVRTGTHVRLTFHHAGEIVSQKHNWVLVRPGELQGVMRAADKTNEGGGWTPKSDPRVLAATDEIPRGQTTVVEFDAPTPGDYPFLCTTAGHGADMHGVLRVTP
jgi:azurin